MNHRIILSLLVLSLASLSSCGGESPKSSEESKAPHTEHVWGPWQRDEDEHLHKCTVCGKTEYGPHEGFICETCADFRVLGLGFLEGGDGAHCDFAQECNEWFPKMGRELGFLYDFSTEFSMLNEDTLEDYDAVMFLNNMPSVDSQRKAFEDYMENGGGWIGFHVCAFTTDSNDWPWYHETFLGSGNFRTNTWNPTRELLKVETHNHPATKDLPDTFMTSPNEWYGWTNDLRENDDIDILLSLDDSTFPVGDRQGEIWYNETGEDYYPVAWANRNYNMVYMNMGHNLMSYNDFEKKSKTFTEEMENQFVLDSLYSVVGLKE